jgi:membrane protein YqaA with SNARE-associated domain
VGPIGARLLAAGWAATAFESLRRLGAVGVFLLAAGDSSFLFFPFGNDLLLISLVASHHGSFAWILYVVAAVAGSVVGVTIVDLVMRKIGEEGVEYFVRPKTVERVRCRLEKRAGVFVFAGTLIPPPFPFTAVVMTASALQTPRCTLLVAVALGRLVRYTIDALLAIYFGERILAYLQSDVVEYAVWGLVAITIVGTALSIRKWAGARRSWSNRPAHEAG